jgi:phosphatidylserine/phosphatidylglycerophosphate/cardiolipin synthase-like enzyme
MLPHKSRQRSTFLGLLAVLLGAGASLAQEVHFSPEERLDVIDAALIGTAKQSIDFASYALTDPQVLDALNDAEGRGVAIRIVLDPREIHASATTSSSWAICRTTSGSNGVARLCI